MGFLFNDEDVQESKRDETSGTSGSEPESDLDEWQTQKKQKKVSPEWWDDAEQVVVDQLPDNIDDNVIYKIRGTTANKKVVGVLHDGRKWEKIAPLRGKVMTV